jgi:hypothetical protein
LPLRVLPAYKKRFKPEISVHTCFFLQLETADKMFHY